jgi:hypothetical protein
MNYLADVTFRELVGEALKEKPLVLACKLICSMNVNVASRAQGRLIRATNNCCRSFLTHITLNFHLPTDWSHLLSSNIFYFFSGFLYLLCFLSSFLLVQNIQDTQNIPTRCLTQRHRDTERDSFKDSSATQIEKRCYRARNTVTASEKLHVVLNRQNFQENVRRSDPANLIYKGSPFFLPGKLLKTL